jgi:hypothetical protein
MREIKLCLLASIFPCFNIGELPLILVASVLFTKKLMLLLLFYFQIVVLSSHSMTKSSRVYLPNILSSEW